MKRRFLRCVSRRALFYFSFAFLCLLVMRCDADVWLSESSCSVRLKQSTPYFHVCLRALQGPGRDSQDPTADTCKIDGLVTAVEA
jgi:hypothetical protein